MSRPMLPEADHNARSAAPGDPFPQPGPEPDSADEDQPVASADDDSTPSAEPDGHPSRREELAREVVVEIHALRAALDEMLQSFGARVHGELAAAARRLEEAGSGRSDAPLPSTKALGVLLHDLRAVKVKPRKGRPKDLTRISRAAEELAELVDES